MILSTTVRALTLGITTAALALAVAACGSGAGSAPDKAGLVGKLAADENFKGVPGDVTDCMAEVALKLGDQDDLKSYMAGKITLEQVKGLGKDDKAAEAEAEKCTNLAD
ncbi:hypothetical protein [Nonomuraea sp. NPDC049695]|uniref:hypothetical protein n=1 Tax=Nonomuraea sp. NPDC049695 TaxID=3154734 RepID=UPI003442C406